LVQARTVSDVSDKCLSAADQEYLVRHAGHRVRALPGAPAELVARNAARDTAREDAETAAARLG